MEDGILQRLERNSSMDTRIDQQDMYNSAAGFAIHGNPMYASGMYRSSETDKISRHVYISTDVLPEHPSKSP